MLKFLFCLHGFHHVKKLQGGWFFLMSEKQRGVTSEDRILDHLIDVRDTKIPLHQEDQGLDDLHVLLGHSSAVSISASRSASDCCFVSMVSS